MSGAIAAGPEAAVIGVSSSGEQDAPAGLDRSAAGDSRAGVATLVGVLAACVVYAVITPFTLFAETGNCLGDRIIRSTPECQATLSKVAVPGRYAALVALLCGVAAIVGWMDRSRSVARTTRRWGRHLTMLEPALVTVLLVALASLVVPAMRSGWSAIVTAALVWVSLRMAGTLAAGYSEANAGDHGQRPPPMWLGGTRSGLVDFTLIGIPVTVAGGAVTARFDSVLRLPHLSAETVVASAGVYAVTAMLLLAHEHYAALRRGWTKRHAVVSGPLGLRWLGSCSLLVAALLLAALISPSVVGDASRAAGGASARVLTAVGLLSPGGLPTEKAVPCHHGRVRCPGPPRDGPLTASPHARGRHGRASAGSSSLFTRILTWLTPILTWLTPIVIISFLFWNRDQTQRGATEGLLLMMARLQNLWRKLRQHSRRMRTALTDYMPVFMIDAGAAGLGPLARHSRRGTLPPREQIQRYYLDTLSYARHRGMARTVAQSPEEFCYTVAQHLVEGHDAWDALTEDFVEARYSLHPIQLEQVTRARSNWRLTRGAIRDATKRGPPRGSSPD
jgi:hypothetical protein